MFSIQANQELVGVRIDKALCKKFSISFGLAQKIIRAKKVKINQQKVDASYKIEEGDHIEIFSDLNKRDPEYKNKNKISDEKLRKFFSLKIFEDDNLVAFNKPSGLATQGGSGISISVDDFIATKKWQLVHRLDKDTSGILLVAKNNKTYELLTQAFRDKTIKKTYLALVCGNVKKTSGTVNIPLRKKLLGKNEGVAPDFEQGKEAVTNFRVLRHDSDTTTLELNPLTGRTHQLRVHCKEIGHAIVNDMKYGGPQAMKKDSYKRLCLHAYKIEIADYFGRNLLIKSDLPDFITKI